MNNKPTSNTGLEPTEIAATQTIIRADNGDVIVADQSGLRMRLSDRVIEDIAMRHGKLGDSFGDRHHAWDANKALDDVDSLSKVEELSDLTGENIDCWDLRQSSEFVSFMEDLSGRQGVWGFLKHLQGGGIIADTAGPLQVILAIGGTRAALASSECARYPYHGVAPADDIWAVGCRQPFVPCTAGTQLLASLFCACGNGWFAQRIRACEWAGIENLVVCATNAMSAVRSLGKRTALDDVLGSFFEGRIG